MAEPEIKGELLVAKPKRIFNVDDVDLAMVCGTVVVMFAIGVVAYKIAGQAAATAVTGIVGTTTTFLGSLARGRKKPQPAEESEPIRPGGPQ